MGDVSRVDSETSVSKSPKNPFWMADLYVSRQKAGGARSNAEGMSGYVIDRWNGQSALEIAKRAERYMRRPDFQSVRKTDLGYRKLVEQFAMLIGEYEVGGRGIDLETNPAIHGLDQELFNRQQQEFEQRADKIAKAHGSPKERLAYAAFAIQSFVREFRKPIEPPDAPKYPVGVNQLLDEMVELKKQKGRYQVYLGDYKGKETMNRLEALGRRSLDTIVPVPPTPAFLTREPEDNLNRQLFGERLQKKV